MILSKTENSLFDHEFTFRYANLLRICTMFCFYTNEYVWAITNQLSFLTLQVLCDARNKLEIKWENSSNDARSVELLSVSPTSAIHDSRSFADVVPLIRELWKDQAIKEAFNRRAQFQLVSLVLGEIYLNFSLFVFMIFLCLSFDKRQSNFESVYQVPTAYLN